MDRQQDDTQGKDPGARAGQGAVDGAGACQEPCCNKYDQANQRASHVTDAVLCLKPGHRRRTPSRRGPCKRRKHRLEPRTTQWEVQPGGRWRNVDAVPGVLPALIDQPPRVETLVLYEAVTILVAEVANPLQGTVCMGEQTGDGVLCETPAAHRSQDDNKQRSGPIERRG